MSADKYPSIFSRQMATIVYIANDNTANQIHGFTIDYGKFILIIIIKYLYSAQSTICPWRFTLERYLKS